MGFRISVQSRPGSPIKVIDFADDIAVGYWPDEKSGKEIVAITGFENNSHKFRQEIENTGKVKFIIEQGFNEKDEAIEDV